MAPDVQSVHVVGAGVAGLAAAVRLSGLGYRVTVYESAGHAGGRCRSYYDDSLGTRIDNGNHLLLSGNQAVFGYLKAIGAEDSLSGPEKAEFPFLDLADNTRWTLRPGAGPIPWWIFNAARRVPESSPWDYFGALKLAWAEPEATVADVFGGNRGLYRRFWEPLAVAVLNTSANEASASLLWPVVRETFGRGESACRPRIARRGLSESFVDPALAYLTGRGSRILFNHRLRAIEYDGDRAMTMDFGAERIPLSPEEHLILALPPAVAKTLVPDLTAPTESRPIVNAHFRLGDESREKVDISFLGLVGGACHWLFIRDGIASVTVSAADALAERSSDEIAARLWMELGGILGKKADSPPLWRIVKEKRATFAQTPEQVLLRPSSETRWKNLYLAGDWTKTGLPATIEGAIRSGYTAAGLVAERGAKS